MPNIYKVLVNDKVTKNNFKASTAKKIVKHFKEKGIEAKIVLYRKNVKIFDLVDSNSIEYYMEEQVDNG
jgi:hypothetical protein